MPRRLLILTCSARKRDDAGMLPAQERYDGPLWQVFRSVAREQPLFVGDVDVQVLSAAYGLIPATEEIPFYDQSMTEERAQELHDDTVQRFRELLESGVYDRCCFGLSQLYLRALTGWESVTPAGVDVTVADGPMGEKLSQVKGWLLGEVKATKAPPPDRLAAPERPAGRATVAGVAIACSREDVLAIARAGLQAAEEGIQRYRDWYVLVDDQRVAPKWLISKLTGRSTSDFSAADARRGLLALGIDVERVING
jgi:hypothetical protein